MGGLESLGISNAGQTVLARLGVLDMAPAYQLCGSVALWEKVQKRAMASARLDVRHFSFSLYATGAFQASTPLLKLRGSESV